MVVGTLRFGYNLGYEVWYERYARRLLLNVGIGTVVVYLHGGLLNIEPQGWGDEPYASHKRTTDTCIMGRLAQEE
jgi:hypothetical protein